MLRIVLLPLKQRKWLQNVHIDLVSSKPWAMCMAGMLVDRHDPTRREWVSACWSVAMYVWISLATSATIPLPYTMVLWVGSAAGSSAGPQIRGSQAPRDRGAFCARIYIWPTLGELFWAWGHILSHSLSGQQSSSSPATLRTFAYNCYIIFLIKSYLTNYYF